MLSAQWSKLIDALQELGTVKRETMLSKLASSLLKSQLQPGAFKCDYDPMTRSRDFRILIVGPPAAGTRKRTPVIR